MLGSIPSSAVVGPVMMHEHLLWDARGQWESIGGNPTKRLALEHGRVPFRADLAGPARFNVLSYRENWANSGATGLQRAVAEVAYLLEAGGVMVVDLTPHGIGPDPGGLRRLSTTTGLHVVASSGIYTHDTHESWMETATVEEFETFFRKEVSDGIGASAVRPGILGEMGTSARPRSCELRALRAAARVAAGSGLSLNIHCHPGSQRVTELLIDITTEEGLSPERTILSHLDEIASHAYLSSVLARGVTLCFDGFGHDHYAGSDAKRRSDRQKMRMLARLVNDGRAPQLTMSQDVCRLHMMRRFGGGGYDHVLARVVPTLRGSFDLDDDALRQILEINPRRLLEISGPPNHTRQSPMART